MSNGDRRETHSGGCLCGAVTYQVTGPLRPVIACHCGQCRRTSGHFVAATAAWRDDVRLTEDRGLAWYRSSARAERGFCTICGSSVLWRAEGSPTISIMAGTLDEGHGLATAAHIFVADKGAYYEIADGLPQREDGDHGLWPDS